jgi:hypothetical protein
MARLWNEMLEAACFQRVGLADNYAVLCLVAANGELAESPVWNISSCSNCVGVFFILLLLHLSP